MSMPAPNVTDLVERIEKLERAGRRAAATAAFALLLAVGAGLAALHRENAARNTASFASLEVRRLLLRDARGVLRAVLETGADEEVKLALGRDLSRGAAPGSYALLGVEPGGQPTLLLRRAAGEASVQLTAAPEVRLRRGTDASVTLAVPEGGGPLLSLEQRDRPPFRLPARPRAR